MRKYFVITCTAALLMLLPISKSVAHEGKIFKLTDFSGQMEIKNLFRTNDNQSKGVETNVQDFNREMELGLSTHGYIYHPYMFDFDIGGGIEFSQSNSDRKQSFLTANDSIKTRSDIESLLWNMNLFMQFLKQKSYPVTLSYSRNNPTIQTGIEGSFTQINENYGLNMQLTGLLPVNLFLNATRNTARGETLDRIIDNTYDRVTFKADKRFTNSKRASFSYELTQMDSRSGDPRKPIRETQRLSHRTSFDSNWRFGSRDQFFLMENASYNWSNNPDVMNLSLEPNFRWQHTSKLASNYRYSFLQTERPESDFRTKLQSATASVRYTPTSRLYGNLAIDGDQSTQSKGFMQNSYGSNIHVKYTRPVFLSSELGLSGGLDYQFKDREASLAQIDILEESHRLTGTAPITLAKEFVVSGTVVVRNETDTQTFMEDVDYRLINVGSQMQIERLIGGSILDGETVLIDYEIETGGTFGYSIFNQNFSADLTLAQYYKLFLNYRGSDQTILSGIPTTPLNSVKSVEVGSRVDLPLRWQGAHVGGGARYTYQDENINPFSRISLDAYAQVPLPYQLNFRINVRYSLNDNFNSDEDQNLIAVNGNLNWRASQNLKVTAEGYYDEDDGGAVLRSRTEATLRANWRFHRLSLSVETKYRNQVQGNLEKDELSLWLVVRRELF